MTDKELRKLRRDDLLQILLNQQRQLDELNAALEKARADLEKRDIAVAEAGSVAEAALRLNDVFGAAQAAADQYADQMRERADRLVADAQQQSDAARRLADDVVRNARSEADRIIAAARREAETIVRPAAPQPAEAPAPADEDTGRRRGLFRRNR